MALPSRVVHSAFFIGCQVNCSDPQFCNDDYINVGHRGNGALIVI